MRTLVVLALAATAAAADLKPETLRAYEGYVAWTDDRVKTDLSNGSPFLWLAGLAENRRQSVDRQLRKGDLVTQDFRPSDLEVPDGMIHHWVTTAFIPGATLTETLAVLLDFENYGKIHQPYFQRSRLLERKGNDCRVQLRVYRRTFFVSMVADADLEVHTTMLDSGRAVLRMQALRIQEIDDAGESGERPSEPGNERGFLWRYVSYYRVAQSKDGAYLQAEAISLSKGIFFPMGTFLRGVHKDSLEDIVRNTKDELIARKKGR